MENVILHCTPLNELKIMIGEVIAEKLKNFKPETSLQTESQKRYLTRKEVCSLLKISLSTLHYYTKDGTLQGLRIGGHILYNSDKVHESIQRIQETKYKHTKA